MPVQEVQRLVILVAEDNPISSEFIVKILSRMGHQVTAVENGQQALDQLARQQFDCILMDIQMPVMNGYEATKKIRALHRSDAGRIPIIAMTANAFTEDRIRAKEAGMDEHVAKPVDVELLMKVIYSGSAMKH